MEEYKKLKVEEKKLDLDYYENVILINSLNNSEYLASIIDHADADYFQDAKIKLIFKKIVEFFNDRGACPNITEIKSKLITDEEKGSFRDVITKNRHLLEEIFNKEELYYNTERFLKERGLWKTVNKVAEDFQAGKKDITIALKEFERIYAISLTEDLGHWYFEEIESHIKDLVTTYNPMPTGWKSLDEKIEGGLFPKTLTCFVGQVNVGKSIVLGNITVNMTLKNKNVLLISCEMSEFMYSRRISSQLSQIPHNELRTYTDKLREEVEGIGKALDGNKLIIKEYSPKSVTVRHIDAYISKLKHKGFKPDIIVIDYINLIQPIGKNLNTYAEIKEIAEDLRALAFKHNLPIVTATQFARSNFNKTNPGMEGIAESIALANTCDLMCSIWQTPEDKLVNIINMGMMKNRFGVNFGDWLFKVNYPTLTLTETNKDLFAEDAKTEIKLKKLEGALSKLESIK